MSCQADKVFRDGDVVWVKLSNCWWPGEVHGEKRLPADMLSEFSKKKKPIAVVKFFQEDAYEYVKNANNIHSYVCERRLDFIRKGLDLYQANHKYMEMFPADVATAERRTHGNPDIINDPVLLNPAKQAASSSKRWAEMFNNNSSPSNNNRSKRSSTEANQTKTKPLPVASPSANSRPGMTKEHEIRILSSSVGKGGASSQQPHQQQQQQQQYKCHLCNFSSGRMNLLILHSKSHTSGAAPSSLDSPSSSASSTPRRSSCFISSSPSKRLSTASGSTSPASEPPEAPQPVVADRRRRRRTSSPPPPPTPPPPASSQSSSSNNNKSKPPKKRTKRVPSSLDDSLTVAEESASVAPPSRRSRNRNRSVTPPILSPPEIEKTKEIETTSEPPKSSSSASVTVNRMASTLLKDWSDDEDDDNEVVEEEEKRPVQPPTTSPEKSKDSSDRSSPVRCRNIPKKDRREIVIEEFQPKSPPPQNPPEECPKGMVVEEKEEEKEKVTETEKTKIVTEQAEEETKPEEPIVQKKKKAAAIERLSQLSQEDPPTPPPRPPPPVQPPTTCDPSETVKEENSAKETSSCFDFDEDSPQQQDNAAAVAVDQQLKLEAETKDQELFAKIGSLLNATSELAAIPVPILSPTKTKLSELSLPPKERGKRIFKSRNATGDSFGEIKREDEMEVEVDEPMKTETCIVVEEKEEEKEPPRKRKIEDENDSEAPETKKTPRKEPFDRLSPQLDVDEDEAVPVILPDEVARKPKTLDEEEEEEKKEEKVENNKSNGVKIAEGDEEQTKAPIEISEEKVTTKSSEEVEVSQKEKEEEEIEKVVEDVESSVADSEKKSEEETPKRTNAINGALDRSPETESPPSVAASAEANTPTDAAVSGDQQILAIPAETFGGPANSFYLCTVDDGNFIPIDNQPLYLDALNQLVPTPQSVSPSVGVVVVEGHEVEETMEPEVEEVEGETVEEGDEEEEEVATISQILIGPDEQPVDLTDTEQKYILTTGNGQQILLDLQSLLTIASGGEARLLLPDGQEMLIEGSPQEILSSVTISPPMTEFEEEQATTSLLGRGVAENPVVYPNVSTAAYVSETNAVLTQPPIMSTLETPSKAGGVELGENNKESGDLEKSLAVLGVKKEGNSILPITITNPKIAAKTTQATIKSVYMTTSALGVAVKGEEPTGLWKGEQDKNGHEEKSE